MLLVELISLISNKYHHSEVKNTNPQRKIASKTMIIRLVSFQSPSVQYPAMMVCCSSGNNAYIPKLEPFSRSRLDRIIKDPLLIQKSKNDLAGTLSNYSTYLIMKEVPKEEMEIMILESGGVKSFIVCLHGISEIHKAKKQWGSNVRNMRSGNTTVTDTVRACPETAGES
ncbi:hypothetical protein R6Q57_021606 [Mikania cordata]